MAKATGHGLSAAKLRELARVGAGHGIEGLRAEIVAIERTFPELKLPTSGTGRRGGASHETNKTDFGGSTEGSFSPYDECWAERRRATAKTKWTWKRSY